MKVISNHCLIGIVTFSASMASGLFANAQNTFSERQLPSGGINADFSMPTNQLRLSGSSHIASECLNEKTDKQQILSKVPVRRAVTGEEVYFENFDEVENFENFTVIDSNEDGITWQCDEGDGFAYVRYNRELTMDDWMITPAIELEQGTAYQFEIICAASDRNTPEAIEVFAGMGTSVANMTVPVIGANTIVSETLKGIFVPSESGLWHFGLHGISEPDMGLLAVLSIVVTVAPPIDAPNAPEYLEIIPDYDGTLTSEVKVSVPTKNLAGELLSSIEKLVVTRDQEIIRTFENPTPGETLSFYDDSSWGNGYHLYTAYAVNGSGEGMAIEKMGFTGINKASAPLNPIAVEHGDTGLVTLTWDAPLTNIDGYPMNPELVSYVIMSEGYDMTDDTTIDIQAVPEGEMQRFEYFLILSRTDAGINATDYARTIPAPYGLPYSTPFEESLKNSEFTTGWIFNCNNFKAISTCDDPVATPIDDDGGMLAAIFYEPAELLTYSAKIAIPEEGHNVFSFYYFNNLGKSDLIRPLINEQPVEELTIGAGSQNEWVKVEIPLDEYNGSSIRIGFSIDSKESNVLIDNITVAPQYTHDLKINSVLAPSTMNIGETTPITIKVANIGASAANGYSVDLIVDDKVLLSKEATSLQKDAIESFVFEITPTVAWGNDVNISAVVNYSDDLNLSNNISETRNIIIIAPQYPYVKDLTAEESTNGVILSWSKPDLDNNIVCEDFEGFLPFSIEGGNGWTTYDGDRFMTYGLEGVDYPNKFDPKSWMTLDISSSDFNSSWSSVSGNKLMASFSASEGNINDWLISPKLDGRAQTISLFARSYVDIYGLEEFSLYYSTSSNNPEDFQQLGEVVTPAAQWDEYSWNLPEGAQYFAIVCTSFDRFVLLIDDVSFCLPFDKENNQLIGFNIYRNGELLNSVSTSTTTFTDLITEGGLYNYNVTAIYTKGESRFSNTATYNTVSMETIELEDAKVSGGKGAIQIDTDNSKEISIYDVSGNILVKTGIHKTTVIPMEKGLYIVKISDRIFKVIVR